ncbi:hypothetical protein SEA_SASSAY_75 [Mycobacterium phage Sassay]|nr:hypothetical protein SEA_TEARDROPMSU_76 [Mycobacterium phage TeardropMSU]ATN91685.1 hypothetical protein SEA_SASSAY_75 [Mycobacterium phage Sassay]ATN92500.1 hypothetical protein SEA_WILLEZ_75 [Mycobacterium phage Willez]ATN92644.1 hypothetical protein SEA_YASSJOHNNY_77 [Mycobacterium phage YassJohnny]
MATGTVTTPTVTQLAEEVKRLAAEYPDKRADCIYFRDGQPCCIIGHALAKFGYTEEDAWAGGWNVGVDVSDLAFAYGVIQAIGGGEEWDVMRTLGEVQDAQDSGKTWATAVKALSE